MGQRKSKQASPLQENDNTKIIIAIIGVIGVLITAYFGYRQVLSTIEVPIQATQTAEANQTIINIPTETDLPSPTIIPTDTPAEIIAIPTTTEKSYTIAITEVMANPCGFDEVEDATWNEYVELYNYGNLSVDVNGWWLSDGENKTGNPDKIVTWDTRFPGSILGSNIQTSTTIIPPGKIAVVISPQYLVGKGSFVRPYIIPENTLILTIASGEVLGSDDFGIEVVQIRNPVTLYEGTENIVNKIISTYGTPTISGSPINLRDDELDGIPFALPNCYSVERIIVGGPDAEFNWRRIKDGSLGLIPESP